MVALYPPHSENHQQTWQWRLHEVAGLIKNADLADALIILNHCKLPSHRSSDGILARREALACLARLPNTMVKLPGIGLAETPWRYQENVDIIHFCIDIFGPDRARFASNFPVDGLCTSFDTLYGSYRWMAMHYTEAEQEAMFYRTAAHTYSIQHRNCTPANSA